MKFCIHLTKTGIPDDSEYLDTIQIKEEENLINLKKKILSMPQMKPYSDIVEKYEINSIIFHLIRIQEN